MTAPAMNQTLRTAHGDTIDGLLWRHLGRNDETITDAFWRLNSHAAALGPIFPAGVSLQLPALPATADISRLRAWD